MSARPAPESPARASPRILFVSPCGPYPKGRADADPIDFFYYRNTLGQRVFMLRSFQSWYPLHLLAQNLPVRSVVLENPSPGEFHREVQEGGYQVVAIAFTVTLTGHVLEMARWLRTHAPGIEIIVGGYGTAVFESREPEARELRSLVDGICTGEGIAFMKRWLADRWGVAGELPLGQDLLPARHSLFRTRLALFRQVVVVGALGCPHGCGFCATSHQFGKRRIELASGRELAQLLARQRRLHPSVDSAIVYDEDFLLDRPRFLEYLAAVEADPDLQRRPLSITIFASLRSLRRCSVEELVRAGVGTVYVGVESLSLDVLVREGLSKRGGDPAHWFGELHRHGIHTLGSLILGWDGQDRARAEDDIARFVALHPTFYQVVPLHPVPGTPLWKTLEAEGRLDRSHGFEGDQVGRFTFKLADLTHREAMGAVSHAYRALVEDGGPWPFRLVENLVQGVRTLERARDQRLRRRAGHYRRLLRSALPLAVACRPFFWGRGFRSRWRTTMRGAAALAPAAFLGSVLAAPLLVPLLVLVHLLAQARHWLSPQGDQPEVIRVEYDRAGG